MKGKAKVISTDAALGLLEAQPRVMLPLSAALAALIAVLDQQVHSNISLGLLYAIPIMMAAPAISRWQILIAAACCAVLREHFAPFGWEQHAEARLITAFLVFAGTGLFVSEMARGRRMALQYTRELKEQNERREEAENQLKMLVESSPAAIVTLDAEGRIDIANLAAHEMLAVPAGTLRGAEVGKFLPVVADLLQAAGTDQPYRSATNCRGRRANGEAFLACVWFATYPTRAGRRLAAIVTDTSEDLRDWQETSLQSLLRSTRVLVGSVSHEIRNICAAISVVHANLGRLAGVAKTEDYVALGTLAQGLSRLATVELQSPGEPEVGRSSLEQLLDEFRIVISPTLESSEVELQIMLPENLPPVMGDRHGLLQVLLNLSRNSIRALEGESDRRISLHVQADAEIVLMRFKDSGRGVIHPERLFQPFQMGAEEVGLGLFVSRAIVRAFGGELYFEPSTSGCTMCLRLKPYPVAEAAPESMNTEMSA